MSLACFANVAAARGDTPRTPRLLKFKKEGVRGLPERVRAAARSRSDHQATNNTPSDDDDNRSLTLHR
jgi:hypothetical protein